MGKTKPFHVVQLFDNSYQYGKDLKSFEDRKEKFSWKKEIESKNGFVENHILKTVRRIELQNFNVLLLIDYNVKNNEELIQRFGHINYQTLIKLNDASDSERNQLYNNLNSSIDHHQIRHVTKTFDWKCLRFSMNENLEVHLKWNYWEIGYPTRDNFKICELPINTPTEININGKQDSTASVGKERTFIERNFIIEYKGMFTEIEQLSNEDSVIKQIPKPLKRVNLLKELY